jgi:predicted dehydrogenase
VVAHFATTRPKEGGNRRFGLHIYGSKGVIELKTGWLPPDFLLTDPTWTGATTQARWTPITSAGLGKPEPIAGNGSSMVEANRLIVADLIHAVEADTQPRASVYDGRAALEMLLACHASQARGGPVPLPLVDRTRHPLETLAEA